MLYGAPTPRRRDAQRNRSAIVRVASELMLRHAGVLMPEIARRAGVGQATLYRHFRDRPALVEAVVADQLERLEAVISAGSCTFREVLVAALRLYARVRPLAGGGDRLAHRLGAALAPVLRRAQEQGRVRPDLTPADLTLLVTMLSAADPERSIALLLDGVCR
ncbi:TetR/AcrR family transcriptional regulator [Dactylosporangium matsuzakiense]|uniref:Transcriptional regulator n=1 Tax=Dactylosporangium matsuzakiense TaxID=53360 RepID=A0A9W6KSA1_9ACTN|nr:TetR/AcrR family transcriptional regulator [Dactylosporangium matsuzakiense]UWZ47651.1 TetR/AcrR family transcriptional regulator [Dactylosporangium matsuzakiense]GLL05601.1 transcriptional regulator [Dactylosporangium matsuzakiense]